MSFLEWAKEVLVRARRTKRQSLILVLILPVFLLNVMPLSDMIPREIGLLSKGNGLLLSVRIGRVECSMDHGLIWIRVHFCRDTTSGMWPVLLKVKGCCSW